MPIEPMTFDRSPPLRICVVGISDAGGTLEPVTELDLQHGERSHRFASLLPGEQALIYTVAFDGINSYDDARIDLWDLKSRRKKILFVGGTSATYSPSGHIVYARAGKLMAVPFDASRRQITGTPFEALNGLLMSSNTGAAQFSLSRRGDLAYVPGSSDPEQSRPYCTRARPACAHSSTTVK